MMSAKSKPAELKGPRYRAPPSFAGLLLRVTIARLVGGLAYFAIPVLGLVFTLGFIWWLIFDWGVPHAH